MNTWRALSRLGLICGLLVSLWSVRPAEAQLGLGGELAVGSWYGRAVPINPATAPFPEVIMTPTFFADGTLIANDSHEDTNPHATSHGHWIRTTSNRVEATFIWINLTDKAPNGFAGAMKVRLTGQIDPARPDEMKGNVTPVLFPPGTDPMDPKDTGGIPLGTFVIAELRRIKTDSKNVGDPNLSGEYAAGSWYGRAIPDNPATSPFPEVIMSPTFFGDGTLIANDSHEVTNPHTTSHGNWVRTGANRVEATFVWINLTDKAPNGFAGAMKVRITGAVDPSDPNRMTGKVAPVLFPPGTDPLDPKDTGGQPLGIFTIAELRRIETRAVTPPVAQGRGRATILATVTQNGAPVQGLNLSLTVSVSGRRADYRWRGVTDARGLARVEIVMDPGPFWQTGASGYYRARATSVTGDVIGEWGSIPIQGGKETTLSLPVGGSARIDAERPLQAGPSLTLGGNFPNPFNPATQIAYRVQEAGRVSLVVYNLIGQEVRTLVRGLQQAGDYRVTWDGRDNAGRPVTSGVYFYEMAGGGSREVRQMMLLK